MKVKKAEITAFLSLIVVLLISFIFGIIEITVIQTEKNLSRICADGAIFSVFGEYESQLMEAYHIFGLDGSYGTGEFNEDKIIGRMHYYSNKNIDYKINGIQYLTDNKGQAFREQVLTYMEQKYGIGLIEDLAGRTIYLTGKGTTPDYVLHYILSGNGMDADSDCTLEYKSEATEVAALLAENPDAIGLFPQPFVTAACAQNDALSVILDMNAEWEKLQGEDGSRLVTGVTVVRNEFLQEHENAVVTFMEEHQASAQSMNSDVENGAKLAAASEIIAKEPIALKAIPKCNITYIDGADMKQALSGYLEVLYGQNPESIGGALPGGDFYYVPQK